MLNRQFLLFLGMHAGVYLQTWYVHVSKTAYHVVYGNINNNNIIHNHGAITAEIARLIMNFEMTYLYPIQNHQAERHWVEVNSRVNFPIKRALVTMQQDSIIDMDCQVGIKHHIMAWNNHSIPGSSDVIMLFLHHTMFFPCRPKSWHPKSFS